MNILKPFYPVILLFLIVVFPVACGNSEKQRTDGEMTSRDTEQVKKEKEIVKKPKKELPENEEGWKEILTDEEYHILRERGTEPAGTGDLLHNKEKGTYICAGCGKELFASDTKFKSGSGWPSFWDKVSEGAVKTVEDNRGGMTRTEVLCGRCGGHLGHVFNDGPEPTGLRYCINSAALDFRSSMEDSDMGSEDQTAGE